jgi:hypothetical protein
MIQGFTLRAALWVLCLIWLPLAPAWGQTRPIEGHEYWKLGMSMAEARAAEPRAEPHDCDESICLHYADKRFATAEIVVSAHFTSSGTLDVILITMTPDPSDNRCIRLSAQLAAFYTAAHGETMPVSPETWIWGTSEATLTLLSHCQTAQGVINIIVESRPTNKG